MIRLGHRSAFFATFLVWLICWVSSITDLHAAAPLPPSPTPSYILDEAKWLSPSAFLALDEKLKGFERETSSQYIVAIFPKIPDGEEMVDFSQRLFESWKPGQKGKDNGAIFLIFAEDRKMRIHTGFGMEGVLPDARSKQIIEDVVAPLLREGNREAAINAGIDAMIAAAKGEYTGTGKTQLDGNKHGKGSGAGLILLVFLGLIVLRLLSSRSLTAADILFTVLGASRGFGGGNSGGGFGGGDSGGGFSGGGGDSGGGGASGGW